jgi:hypothetical protein
LKKIIGIIVLILLLGICILSIVTINGKIIEESNFLSNSQLKMAGYIHVKGIDGESKGPSVGLRITIGNLGSVPMTDIDWTFNADGATIVFGDGVHGRIPTLDPGEETHIFLRPGHFILQNSDGQSPIGVGSITLMATAKTSTETLEITEDEFLIGPIIYFY